MEGPLESDFDNGVVRGIRLQTDIGDVRLKADATSK